VSDLLHADRVLEKLLQETTLSLETGDLPVGCALSVDGELVGSDHNTIRSSNGLRFHAERNLLARHLRKCPCQPGGACFG
jgi:tRNA(Arg) A34 adenosine deaminase TadA